MQQVWSSGETGEPRMNDVLYTKEVLTQLSQDIRLERIRRGLRRVETHLPKRIYRRDFERVRISAGALDCANSVGTGLLIAQFGLRNICDSGVVDFNTQQEIYALLERIERALEYV
jgi:hypothetical protein